MNYRILHFFHVNVAAVLGHGLVKEERVPSREIDYRRHFAGKPAMGALLEEEQANATIARSIYDLRTKAKLTPSQLAKLVGTTPCLIEP